MSDLPLTITLQMKLKKVRSTANHYTTDDAKKRSDLPLTITPLMKLKKGQIYH